MKTLVPLALCLLMGCSELVSNDSSRNKPMRVKTTDDIGEFKGDDQVVHPDVNISNPITGALEAYEPLKQQLAQLSIERAVQMFHALEGRYPKDHAEFMQRVIKENNIRLPQTASRFRYEYDVANHKLVVVQDGDNAQP